MFPWQNYPSNKRISHETPSTNHAKRGSYRSRQSSHDMMPSIRGYHSNGSGRGRSLGTATSWMQEIPSEPVRGRRCRPGVMTQMSVTTDGYSFGKQVVTNYVCNICGVKYKHHCSLLTHQVRAHGRQKKKTGRRPRNIPNVSDWDSCL